MSKPRVVERIEKDMSYVLTPKSTHNLMQNCDLPPPIKLYTGPDGVFLSSISKIYGVEAEDDKLCLNKDWSGNDKLEILKALQLSQTRAREAERKLRVLSEEKNVVSKLLVDESMRLFAYRQWFDLLEFQVLKLQRLSQDDDDDEGRNGGKKWRLAMAFCLAITLALGYTYVF